MQFLISPTELPAAFHSRLLLTQLGVCFTINKMLDVTNPIYVLLLIGPHYSRSVVTQNCRS